MNSNIGTSSIVGKIFNPIVTTLSFSELQTLYAEGSYLPVSNSVLFSIPKDANGNDLQLEGSIWLTDSNGYLYPMTPPYSEYHKFEKFMEKYIESNTFLSLKIESIEWNTTEETYFVSNKNPLLSSSNKINIRYENGETGVLDINEYLLNFKVLTNDNLIAGTYWYTNPGTYYVYAIIPAYKCKNGEDVKTGNYITVTIVEESENNENNNNENNNENNNTNNNPTYYYWYIGTDNPSSISNIQTDNTIGGWHEIGSSLSNFTLNTNNNPVHISETRVQYYVIIPNDLHIYNGLDLNIESVTFETVACNISGYKAFKYIPSGGSTGVRDVKGIILKY